MVLYFSTLKAARELRLSRRSILPLTDKKPEELQTLKEEQPKGETR